MFICRLALVPQDPCHQSVELVGPALRFCLGHHVQRKLRRQLGRQGRGLFLDVLGNGRLVSGKDKQCSRLVRRKAGDRFTIQGDLERPQQMDG